MGIDIFDDSGDDDVENLSKIEINKEFAKRYEHNKKREDLQRFEELKKKGLVNDSDSESSESDSDDVDEEDDDVNELLDGLLKIRNKDPILMEKDAKLFQSDDDDDDDDEEENGSEEKKEKEKKKKPKYLKDVNAQHLLEEGPEFGGDDEDEEKGRVRVKSYAEEQEDLRRAVLDAMEEAEKQNGTGDDDDDLFKFKEKEKNDDDDDDGDVGDEELEKKLDACFGEEDENEKFLKEFLKNKMWIDKDKGKRVVEDDLDEVEDDEEALEKQEDYEREYNFRFEEGVSDRVMGHSRVVEGSVRKETNARKQQRERKKERLAQAEIERREEVKRLKNLKKRDIQERLDKIREIAGVGGEAIPLTEEDLEEEFDPDEFDKKMKAAFGDEYYEAEDADPKFGSDGDESESDLEKPDFEKEDELLGLPEDWDVIKSNDGFVAAREKKLKSKVDSEGDSDSDSDEEENNAVGDDDDQLEAQEGKKKRKRKLSLKEKVALDKELEELYKLDYEDAIGDLKTRFKYREVAPRKYGLSAAHILWMDDKELNQYVSLKKLAPYREKEYTVPRLQRKSFMLKRGTLLEAAMNRQMGRKKRRRTELGESSNGRGPRPHEDEKAQAEQPSNDESKLSRAAKRRRRQKEKKLPQSRLAAYGKIPYSSKKKSKS